MSEASAIAFYDRLVAAADPARDPFDVHILAAILAVALADGEGLAAGAGLDHADLARLAEAVFPAAADEIAARAGPAHQRDAEEASVRDVLLVFMSGDPVISRPLAAMVARRCKAPRHLWQDLGLDARSELKSLMTRHFAGFAARNRGDMKWKKFIYRTVCGAEGIPLCPAPTCAECDEIEVCFGDEDGASRLARLAAGAGTAQSRAI
ncbi:nitrogen fixation protein NifQ [Acuticoccus sediminis]|uniref:nitrogen fixation protein NifQ n=1 Tax=Acuticoccus sediminis TaxID=2184697 RepID=UPI001CFE2799|nr:nitrogen fixation protein NifQ [Acuticoccus sediminis]